MDAKETKEKRPFLLLLLLAYFFVLPFQFALSPLAGIDLPIARVGALGIALLWLSVGLMERKVFLPRGLAAISLGSFLFVALFSFFVAENGVWSIRKALFLLSFVPIFFVIAGTAKGLFDKVSLLRAFVFGAALSAAIGIVQFLMQFVFPLEKIFSLWIKTVLPVFLGQSFGEAVEAYPSLLVNIGGATFLRASAFFPDPHMAAFYFGMAFPVALALFFQAKDRTLRQAQDRVLRQAQDRAEKRWMAICAALLLLADLLTFSRGGYVGLSGAALVGGGVFLSRGVPLKRLAIGGATVLFIGTLFLTSPIGERFLSSFSRSDGSNSERLRLWQEGFTNLAERPFLGYGLGNYPLVVKPGAGYREPIYAHNLYLDIALETGLVGLLFFVLFLFGAIFSAWRRWKQERNPLFLGICFSLLVFSFHALFETPLFSVHILPILLLLAALAV